MKLYSVIAANLTAAVLIGQCFFEICVPNNISPLLPPSNTQKRHVDCNYLSQMAEDYYTGEYSIDKLMALKGAGDTSTSLAAMQNNPLFDALHSLMSDTQNFYATYSGLKEGSLEYYWMRTDAVDGSGDYVSFYSDIPHIASASGERQFAMEREHIWPQSSASYSRHNGGADLHHLRPSVSEINRAKNNYKFADINGIYPAYTNEVYYKDVLYAWADEEDGCFECKDDVKGDVARILLYVYCRWEQPNLYTDTDKAFLPEFDDDDSKNDGQAVIEGLDTLLTWIENDPVDTWEMERNDLVEQVQGNRNVFIDYPELAWKMFGREIPENIQTPTHNGCHHNYSVTELIPSGCQNEGSFTRVCDNCGKNKIYQIHLILHKDTDTDHLCDHCGEKYSRTDKFSKREQIREGDHIILICKGNGRIAADYDKDNSIPLKQTDFSDEYPFVEMDTAIFCVEKAENGFYLKNNEKYLTAVDDTGLCYADTPAKAAVLQFNKTDDDSFVITCINSLSTDKKTGKSYQRMLESFKNCMTLYYAEKTTDNYKFYVYGCGNHIDDD